MTSIVDSVRQPEYTGENRCVPCTIANSVIAVVLAGAVAGGLLYGSLAPVPVAAGVAVVVLAASAASIWLRGYLVPKTPELTKTYFPDRVLAWFDQEPEGYGTDADEAPETADPDLEPEAALSAAGAVEPCAEVDDLCLTDEFRDDWAGRIERVSDAGVETDDIVAVLDMGEIGEEASLARFGEAVILEENGREIGKWESTAALVADVAAAEALAERYDRWADLDAFDRSRLLRGLRIFLEECPLCGGHVSLGQDTVESCCRSYDVVAVTCGQCEARLFEERWQGGQEAEA